MREKENDCDTILLLFFRKRLNNNNNEQGMLWAAKTVSLSILNISSLQQLVSGSSFDDRGENNNDSCFPISPL